MNKRWTTCSTGCRAAGLTLIEVVAAIAILGAILSGIVLAQSRHLRQIAATQRTDRAIAAADAMLQRWWADPETLPIGQRGRVDGAELRWVTRELANPPIESLEARVIRVAFYPTDADASGGAGSGEPMFVVDLLMPQAERDADEGARQRGGTDGGGPADARRAEGGGTGDRS